MKISVKRFLPLIMALIVVLCSVPQGITAQETNDTRASVAQSPSTDFDYTVANSQVEITGYVGEAEEVGIPAKIQGYPVTKIGSSAFYNCSSVVRVSIPDSVKTIGNSAFLYCSSLEEVTIPDSVTSIENSAFSCCSSLTKITLSQNITEIGIDVFNQCSSLTEIKIPNGVKKIGISAFAYCEALEIVELPASVTEIDNSAFSYCSSLITVTLAEGLKSIGKSAFKGCFLLESITLPESLESIGDSAFEYCYSLTNIIIPEKVTSIGADTFYDCSSLESITIPGGVSSIGISAFNGCEALAKVNYTAESAKWDEINIGKGNDALFNAEKFFSDTQGEEPPVVVPPEDEPPVEEDLGDGFVAQILTYDGTQALGVSGTKSTFVNPDENNRGQLYHFVRQSDGNYKIIHTKLNFALGLQTEPVVDAAISIVSVSLGEYSWTVLSESGKYILKAADTESLVAGVSDGSAQLVEFSEDVLTNMLTVNKIEDAQYNMPAISEDGIFDETRISIIGNLLCEVSDECSNMSSEELNQKIAEFAAKSFELGVKETKAIALCVNIMFLGGEEELTRILLNTSDYSLEGIYSVLITDSGAQVGAHKARNWNFYKNCVTSEL